MFFLVATVADETEPESIIIAIVFVLLLVLGIMSVSVIAKKNRVGTFSGTLKKTQQTKSSKSEDSVSERESYGNQNCNSKDDLEMLKEKLDSGEISEQEYKRLKEIIIDNL